MSSNMASYDRLVALGAKTLRDMFEALRCGNHEAAHYYKGGFQALKDTAYSIFDICSADFRADCVSDGGISSAES